MLIVLTFTVNAGLNFLLGLCVAAVLGPDSYGRFSIAFAAALALSMLLFDWLRLSATRYYTEFTRNTQPSLRASLNASYAFGSVLLGLIALGVIAFGVDVGMTTGLVATTALFTIANGLFEFFGALLRARFRNNAYSWLVILKNLLAFAGMVGAGYYFRDPALVLLMAGLSALAAAFALWRQAADPGSHLRQASRAQIGVYLRYGAPIALANIFYQVIVLANRSFAAAHVDFAAAGKLSLATDMTLRLMLTVGAALDILLFQLAVHRKTTEGEGGAQKQVASNIIIIFSVLTVLCLGYMADMPGFAALIAPQKFRADFASLSFILAPGVTLFCLGQFCLSPIAQLEGRTTRVFFVGLATAGLDLGLLRLAAPKDLAAYAAIHSACLAANFVLMIGLTWRWRAYWPGVRDLAAILFAGFCSAVAMAPLRNLDPPLLALLLTAAVGTGVYLLALYALDPGQLIRPAIARLRAKVPLLLGRPETAVGP